MCAACGTTVSPDKTTLTIMDLDDECRVCGGCADEMSKENLWTVKELQEYWEKQAAS